MTAANLEAARKAWPTCDFLRPVDYTTVKRCLEEKTCALHAAIAQALDEAEERGIEMAAVLVDGLSEGTKKVRIQDDGHAWIRFSGRVFAEKIRALARQRKEAG